MTTDAKPAGLLEDTIATIGPLDGAAVAAARERQEVLTKPSGSLGRLEEVSVQLAGIAGQCPPPMPAPAVVAVFAADHGVHAQGVSPWPQEVTAQMVANFLASGAAVNAIAAQAGAEVCVVDIGVAADLPAAPGLLPRKVRHGTADMTEGPAMSRDEARRAVETGIELAQYLVASGSRCLITGDMGIANTTASAALIAAFTGADPAQVTGRAPASTTRRGHGRWTWCAARSPGTPVTPRTRSACSPRWAGSSTRPWRDSCSAGRRSGSRFCSTA